MAQHDSSLTVHLDPDGALAHTERVVGLLRARRHEVTAIAATFSGTGATLELRGGSAGSDALLVRRLERLTGVLHVEVSLDGVRAPVG